MCTAAVENLHRRENFSHPVRVVDKARHVVVSTVSAVVLQTIARHCSSCSPRTAPTVRMSRFGGNRIQTLFDCILVSHKYHLYSSVDELLVVSVAEAVFVRGYTGGSLNWAQSVCHHSREAHFRCPATSVIQIKG